MANRFGRENKLRLPLFSGRRNLLPPKTRFSNINFLRADHKRLHAPLTHMTCFPSVHECLSLARQRLHHTASHRTPGQATNWQKQAVCQATCRRRRCGKHKIGWAAKATQHLLWDTLALELNHLLASAAQLLRQAKEPFTAAAGSEGW